MEPSISRQGEVCYDVESQNAPTGYLIDTLLVDFLGPSPETAGPGHCIITMQDPVMWYAMAHAIMGMKNPQAEVPAVGQHVWE